MSRGWITTAALVGSEVAVIAGDVAAKRWALGAGPLMLVVASACYAATTASWLLILKLIGDLSRASLLWTASGMVAGPLVGLLWFGEKLSPLNWVGAALCLVGGIAVTQR